VPVLRSETNRGAISTKGEDDEATTAGACLMDGNTFLQEPETRQRQEEQRIVFLVQTQRSQVDPYSGLQGQQYFFEGNWRLRKKRGQTKEEKGNFVR
jgi:hypothetical protein